MLDASLRYDSHDPDALRQKARYLRVQNRLDEAVEALEIARVYGDDDTDLHTLFSRVNYDAVYYEKAARDARRAAELAPNESYPLLRLAMAYNKLFDCANLHAAINAFLASCKALGDCRETNIEWGRGTLEVMETHPGCGQWRQQRDAGAESPTTQSDQGFGANTPA